MNGRWTTIAVVIPLVGLSLLVGRAELALRSGPTWQVAIEGYDPRDLLHGHYLRYRFDFEWSGADECGHPSERAPVAGCCLCLSAPYDSPSVRQVDCDSVRDCDGWLRSDAAQPPLRYFVPEDSARQLEQALTDRQASVDLVCTPSGKPAIGELYLDGRPWRDALAARGVDD